MIFDSVTEEILYLCKLYLIGWAIPFTVVWSVIYFDQIKKVFSRALRKTKNTLKTETD